MTYTAPATVDEACRILASSPAAKVFAGATDILPQAKAGRALPELLVDIKRIPRLSRIDATDEGWIIGAATPVASIVAESSFRSAYPGVAEAAALIGSDQIQNRATLGGNLCNSSPAADTGPPMVINEARAIVASSSGERSIPVSQLMVGPGQTSLAQGEFVVEFILPRLEPRRSDAYLRFTPRTEMDIAVAGVAARVTLDADGICSDAAVVLGAVAPTTVLVEEIGEVLVGTDLGEPALERAAELSRDACRPIDDKRGTKEYRRHLAGILTKRALGIAASRAKESG